MARIASIEVLSYEHNETSFAELQARIAKTKVFIESVNSTQVDTIEDRPITLKFGSKELHFLGQAYLLEFVLPNFYFHVTTTYVILRHYGVEVVKAIYTGVN